MFYYGYIDESGTKSDQEFMTVALVVFEGRRAAERLHASVLNELYLKRLPKAKPYTNLFQIHFADMNEMEKRLLANLFAQSRLSVFVSYYQHCSIKEHDERFYIYGQLVHLVIKSALHTCNKLNVIIAKQGGWQKYEQLFLGSLRPLSEAFAERGNFRKARYELASATNPGIQIADYYAGAFRAGLILGKGSDRKIDGEPWAHQIKRVTAYTTD
jgi:hypothetical protein